VVAGHLGNEERSASHLENYKSLFIGKASVHFHLDLSQEGIAASFIK
jgi:hypothetical protein